MGGGRGKALEIVSGGRLPYLLGSWDSGVFQTPEVCLDSEKLR